MSWLKYAGKRLLMLIPVIICVTFVLFLILSAAPADLHECGLRRFRFEAEFHGKPFKDNQVSKVFCLWLDREAEDFSVQKSEIDYVKWFDLDEAVAAVEQGTIPNCIFPEELGMVKKFVEQTGGGC